MIGFALDLMLYLRIFVYEIVLDVIIKPIEIILDNGKNDELVLLYKKAEPP